MKRFWLPAIAITMAISNGFSQDVEAISLYDGTANQTPNEQAAAIRSEAITSTSIPVLPDETVVLGVGVLLNTASNNAEYSGYSNYDPVSSSFHKPSIFNTNTLNRITGYSITFKLRLDTVTNEVDNTNPRAVFSAIAISSDLMGVEIGFRLGEIFVQSSGFTSEANSAAFTTTSLKEYKLTVLGSNYALEEVTAPATFAPILNGSLVTYSFNRFTSNPPLPFDPYATGSFIFFGDNTGEAKGVFTLGDVDFTPIPFDFAPTGGIIALGAIAGLRFLAARMRDKSSK